MAKCFPLIRVWQLQTIAALNRLIKIGFYTLLRNGQLKEYRRKRQADAHILIAAATTTAAPSSITYIYIYRESVWLYRRNGIRASWGSQLAIKVAKNEIKSRESECIDGYKKKGSLRYGIDTWNHCLPFSIDNKNFTDEWWQFHSYSMLTLFSPFLSFTRLLFSHFRLWLHIHYVHFRFGVTESLHKNTFETTENGYSETYNYIESISMRLHAKWVSVRLQQPAL